MSDGGISFAEMGIGNLPNDADVSRSNSPSESPEQRDAAMFATLAGIIDDNPSPASSEGDAATQSSTTPTTDVDANGVPRVVEEIIHEDGLPFSLPPTGFEYNQEQAENTTPHAPTPTPTTPTFDANALIKSVYGDEVTEEQARAVLQIAKDFERLTPAQLMAMEQIASGQSYAPPSQSPNSQQQGQYPPQQYPQQPQYQQGQYPPQQYPQQGQYPPQQYPQQSQQPQQPQQLPPQYVNPSTPFQIPQDIDPELAQALAPAAAAMQAQQAQYAQLAQQQQQIQQQLEQDRQRRMQEDNLRLGNQINTAADSWKEQKFNDQRINPTEWIMLEREAATSQLLPSFIQQAGGDPVVATHRLLDTLYWQNPAYREREIQAEATKERQRASQQQQRTDVSTALGGGGGARPAAPKQNGAPKPASKGSRRSIGDVNSSGGQGLVDALHAHLNGGVPSQ